MLCIKCAVLCAETQDEIIFEYLKWIRDAIVAGLERLLRLSSKSGWKLKKANNCYSFIIFLEDAKSFAFFDTLHKEAAPNKDVFFHPARNRFGLGVVCP